MKIKENILSLGGSVGKGKKTSQAGCNIAQYKILEIENFPEQQ